MKTNGLIRLAAALLVLPIITSTTACSRYQDYSRSVAESNESSAQGRLKIAKEVVGIIITKFDEAMNAKLLKDAGEKAPMVTFQYTDFEGVTHTNTVYHAPPDPSMSFLTRGLAKSMVIRETVPLVEALIDDMVQEVKKPVTVEDILYRIAEEGGLIVTMGAMYGMTKAMISGVQSNINASASEGGNVSINNQGPSDSTYDQDNSVKTTPAEAPESADSIE